MKSEAGLFAELVRASHLDEAAAATVRGKRHRPDVAQFLLRRPETLLRLQNNLQKHRWSPRGFRLLRIREPKRRVIAVASVEDRVVHTALVKLMEPSILRSTSPNAFACRPGMGTHRALLRLLELQRRYSWRLNLDIQCYFPSIDLEILRHLLTKRFREKQFLAVVDKVLGIGAGIYDAPNLRRYLSMQSDWPPKGQGLPIGSYTSQLFAAQLYLCELDHFVKRNLRVSGYVRYVDDMFFFDHSESKLLQTRKSARDYLWQQRRLRLKDPQAPVVSCRYPLTALGHRITRAGIEPSPASVRRLKKKVAERIYTGKLRRHSPNLRESMQSSMQDMLFGNR